MRNMFIKKNSLLTKYDGSSQCFSSYLTRVIIILLRCVLLNLAECHPGILVRQKNSDTYRWNMVTAIDAIGFLYTKYRDIIIDWRSLDGFIFARQHAVELILTFNSLKIRCWLLWLKMRFWLNFFSFYTANFHGFASL